METNQACLTLAVMLLLGLEPLEVILVLTKIIIEMTTPRRLAARFPLGAAPLLMVIAPQPPAHILQTLPTKQILVSIVVTLVPWVTLAFSQLPVVLARGRV